MDHANTYKAVTAAVQLAFPDAESRDLDYSDEGISLMVNDEDWEVVISDNTNAHGLNPPTGYVAELYDGNGKPLGSRTAATQSEAVLKAKQIYETWTC